MFERCCDWLCFVLVFQVLQVLVCDLKYVLLLFTLLLVLCHVTCIRSRDTKKTVHFILFPRFVGFQQRHGCCTDHKCKLLTRVYAAQQALNFRSKKGLDDALVRATTFTDVEHLLYLMRQHRNRRRIWVALTETSSVATSVWRQIRKGHILNDNCEGILPSRQFSLIQ